MTDYDYNERIGQLKELATYDESEQWEVDMGGIYLDGSTVVLITASGCSCWDGEYDEEKFDSLDTLAASLVQDDRTYGPSLEGAKRLIEQARVAIAR